MGRAVSLAALLFSWLLLGGCAVSPQASLDEAGRARAQGQMDLALARYHQLISQGGLQGGDLALVLTARAHFYHEIKRDRDALEDLDRALRLAPPDFALGYLTRGLVCASLGREAVSRRERHSHLIKAETDLKYFLFLYPGRPPAPPESVPQARQMLALIGEELAQLRAADAAGPEGPEAWPGGPGLAPHARPAPPRVRTDPPAAPAPSVTQEAPEPRQEGRPAIIFRPARPAPPPVPPSTPGPAGPEAPKPAPPAPHPVTRPPAPEPPRPQAPAPPAPLPAPVPRPTPPPEVRQPTPPPPPPTAPPPGKPPEKKEEKKKEDDKKK